MGTVRHLAIFTVLSPRKNDLRRNVYLVLCYDTWHSSVRPLSNGNADAITSVEGQAHPYHTSHTHSSSTASDTSTNTLDAERADRISRLAGLERVATLRGASQHLPPQPAQGVPQQQQPPGYFDNASGTGLHKSTVGSASATGSAGGRNTWASGSDPGDRMSEDQDDVGDSVSSAGLSEEGNASLVGFGEGAGSTVSGPTSSKGKDREGVMSPATSMRLQKNDGNVAEGSPMEGVES